MSTQSRGQRETWVRSIRPRVEGTRRTKRELFGEGYDIFIDGIEINRSLFLCTSMMSSCLYFFGELSSHMGTLVSF